MALTLPRLVIAAAQSGAGKTTVATGLMAVLTRQGLAVQPYKVGPDYIDPTYHTAATGRISRNLDGWMLDRAVIPSLVARSGAGADIALIEGVMGLFDGAGPQSEAGSTAQMAKWLGAPVLLVVDGRGMARTAAALVQGLRAFDPDLKIAGVIFNNLGSPSHYKLLCEVLAAYVPAVKPVGYLGRNGAIQAPERHLGLVPSYERSQTATYLESLATLVSATVDLDAVVALAGEAGPLPLTGLPLTGPPLAGLDRGATPAPAGNVRIGLARDEAFHFYYEDGLDLLRSLGAELIPFSPLRDLALPPDLDALYLGGGFPEVYRAELVANAPMRQAVAAAIGAGLPTYAECGGLMYLTEAIVALDGSEWPMAGVIPVKARMQPKLHSLGYTTAAPLAPCLLAQPGEQLRGHEFHWSAIAERPAHWPPAYETSSRRGGRRPEGFTRSNLLASYVHLHFVANPRAAARFIETARAYRRAT